MQINKPIIGQSSMSEETQFQQSDIGNSKSLVLLIIILLTTVIVGLVIYFWQKSASDKVIDILRTKIEVLEEQFLVEEGDELSQPTLLSKTSVVADESIDGWETYVNSELGFEFKYPRQLSHLETEEQIAEYNATVGKKHGFVQIFSVYAEGNTNDPTGKSIKYKPWKLFGTFRQNNVGKSLDGIMTDLYKEEYFNFEMRLIEIDNKEALRYRHCEMSCGEIVLISINNKLIEIQLYTVTDIEIGTEKDIFDQILSTFKFTN